MIIIVEKKKFEVLLDTAYVVDEAESSKKLDFM